MNNFINKKTKIISTCGPASNNLDTLKAIINNGGDLFRLNMSHNHNHSDLQKTIDLIRKASTEVGKHVGIFIDLQGPKIRLGEFDIDFVTLENGDTITLTSSPCICTKNKVYVDYDNLHKDAQIGDPVYINDGKIKLEVIEIKDNDIICKVLVGGDISNHKGVNLPKTVLSISAFTEKDEKDSLFGIQANVEYIALSFVSTAKDVKSFRSFLNKSGGKNIKIISKVEKQLAIDNVDKIIDASDAVMVARGDLGVEIEVENVPKAQKEIIQKCNLKIKPVIVATQMLESMIQSTTATRAEVSDTANAIYDHCDAVMLSAETAVGIDPANVVQTMANICSAADTHLIEMRQNSTFVRKHIFESATIATSFCRSADQIAEENKAAAILVFTSSGNTPLIASKIDSSIPIIAPTDCEIVCKQMSLFRGVYPMMMPTMYSEIHRWTDMINIAVKHALHLNLLKKGDTVVVTAGIPIGKSNGINSIRIIEI
ncbi:pyruvate kinase [Candidatus Marinamargulisbacteria bacterium SCGC AG-414-C22]|nr:pyruvate kinase [Candidatus Marinamargulisbacteria bacterium SCGC AG-414-C22]